jgi:hypothetical protein
MEANDFHAGSTKGAIQAAPNLTGADNEYALAHSSSEWSDASATCVFCFVVALLISSR